MSPHAQLLCQYNKMTTTTTHRFPFLILFRNFVVFYWLCLFFVIVLVDNFDLHASAGDADEFVSKLHAIV